MQKLGQLLEKGQCRESQMLAQGSTEAEKGERQADHCQESWPTLPSHSAPPQTGCAAQVAQAKNTAWLRRLLAWLWGRGGHRRPACLPG